MYLWTEELILEDELVEDLLIADDAVVLFLVF